MLLHIQCNASIFPEDSSASFAVKILFSMYARIVSACVKCISVATHISETTFDKSRIFGDV